MRYKRLKKSSHEQPGSSMRFPPWLITYSDLITLLLTFFVLLMSMADLDPVRFNAASNSLKGAFGLLPHQTETTRSAPVPHSPPIVPTDSFETRIISLLERRLDRDIEDLGQDGQVRLIRTGPETVMVRIPEALLFSAGESRLHPGSIALLDKIADGIDDHPIELIAEGHSDFFEAAVDESKNWELSAARAVSVLRYFIDNRLLSPDRLSAAGFGSARPLGSASKPSDRSLNRRVDIILRARLLSGTGSANKNRNDIPL